MSTYRRRSKIEIELPAEVREDVNRLLLDGTTYEDVAAFCRAKGHDISKSAVGRYGKDFFEAYRAVKRFEDQAKALTTGADDGMPMEEAVGKMLLQKVMAALVDGSADITENSRLISDVAKLQSAHVQLSRFKVDLEHRVAKTADAVARVAKKGGLTDAVAEEIRRKILGMVAR